MAGWESPIHGHFNGPKYRTSGVIFQQTMFEYHGSRCALCAASLARHGSGFFTSMVSLSMPGVPRACQTDVDRIQTYLPPKLDGELP
jgi:hypothetical protein